MNMSKFKTFKRFDKNYCAWCNIREVPTRRHKYCSDACRISCEMFCYPTKYYGFEYSWYINKGQCGICKHDWVQYYTHMERFQKAIEEERTFNPFYIKHFIPYDFSPEMDHIDPVACGGVTVGHDNIQLICKGCHKIKTKKDRKLIASNPSPKYIADMAKKKADKLKLEREYNEIMKDFNKYLVSNR